jgi:enoyl-CoA hydratase/3-hydroxyacyl-CoA dehydrogenase
MSETDDFEAIELTREDGLATVTLARPESNNTIGPGMLDDLAAAVDRFAADTPRAVLLRGAGEGFSYGADLEANFDAHVDGEGHRAQAELSRWGQRVFGGFRELDCPVVAAIHGGCFGGGMELTMCADLRVAAESAEIGLPEHRIGLLPGWGGTTRLQRLVGQSAAKYVVFTAEPQSAERMREFGFVHEVYPDDEFEARAEAFARDIAGGPPLSRKYTKRAMHDAEPFDEGLEAEAHAFGHLRGSEDLAEGIEAFLTGREPEFEGR